MPGATRSNDLGAIRVQLGREPRGFAGVPVRCHLGIPVVITVPPVLDDGTPFPTLYWLTCPLASKRIARLEAAGEIGGYGRRLRVDPVLASALGAAHADYAKRRDAQASRLPEAVVMRARGPMPTGGVGGAKATTGVKCLHAHYAHTLAGGSNPIGDEVAQRVGPLNCTVPCILDGAPNPAWMEPKAEPRPGAGHGHPGQRG